MRNVCAVSENLFRCVSIVFVCAVRDSFVYVLVCDGEFCRVSDRDSLLRYTAPAPYVGRCHFKCALRM